MKSKPPLKVNFPRVRALLVEELAALASRRPHKPGPGRRPINDLTNLAHDMKVGVTTLTHWHNGHTFPREPQLDKLLDALRPRDKVGRGLLKKQIQQARFEDEHPEKAPVDARPLDYPPLSGSSSHSGPALFDDLLQRVFHLSRRTLEIGSPRTGIDRAEGLVRLRPNSINVCMFDTPDRAADLTTFHSPVRIAVNGVMLAHADEKDDDIEAARDLLARLLLKHTRERMSEFRAVALEQEVGWQYLESAVPDLDKTTGGDGHKPLELKAESFATAALAAALPRTQRVFAFVDEITALKTVRVLAAMPNRWRPVLVFPLSTYASRQLDSKNRLPAFIKGLATVWSEDQALISLLTQGFKALLTQIELVAGLYKTCYDELVLDIRTCLTDIQSHDPGCHRQIQMLQRERVRDDSSWNEGCAIQIAQCLMRLSPSEPSEGLTGELNLPWKQIVDRARALVPPPREALESVREGRFRIAFVPLEPAVRMPREEDRRKDLFRETLDLSGLGFIGRVLHPFQHLADPEQMASPIGQHGEVRTRESTGEERVPEGREDVRVGRLETYDRDRFWKYYRVPFFVPLNAMFVADALDQLRESGIDLEPLMLRRAVSPRTRLTSRDQLEPLRTTRGRLRFLVLDAGAGSELFLQKNEGFVPNARRVLNDRRPSAYAEELCKPGTAGTLAVLVVQLFSCLRTLTELERHGRTGRLVFDPDNERSAEYTAIKVRPMPEYNVGISVNKSSRMWIEFFDDAFPRYLRQERDTLVDLVADFRNETIIELQNLLQGPDIIKAPDIANHMLCLDDDGVERLPEWEPILRPLREKYTRVE